MACIQFIQHKNKTRKIQHKKYNTRNATQKMQHKKCNMKNITQKNATQELCFLLFFSLGFRFVSLDMFGVQKEVYPMVYRPPIDIDPKN